jgi:hypothetical protein
MSVSKLRIIAILGCLWIVPQVAQGQLIGSYYSGILEYRLPILKAVPPTYSGQPSDITTAYLWVDQLMRGYKDYKIDQYISTIGFGDTLKFLAKMLYRMDDDNAPLLYQYEISGLPIQGNKNYSWNYKSTPAHERDVIQNQIGIGMNDSGRAGFLIACDYISDITVTDTVVKNYTPGSIVEQMVCVKATIQDEIKGQKIAVCPLTRPAKKSHEMPLSFSDSAFVQDPVISNAAAGACFNFEYSPDWDRLADNSDQLPYMYPLKDGNGPWLKPGGEYIVFLRLAGVNGDSSYGYFTFWPFWGVFGNSGAMYRVVDGKVVDPYDDFGLGGTNLPVTEWKTRLRARIYSILHP